MEAELAAAGAPGAATAAAARKATNTLWAEHPDANVAAVEPIEPVGIPLVFICHKWDVFTETYTEGEQRKAPLQIYFNGLLSSHVLSLSEPLMRFVDAHHHPERRAMWERALVSSPAGPSGSA